MNRCKYIQPVHPEVKFGVELTELFPPWYLHPALKNLIYLAEINIRRRNGSRFQIEHILGKGNDGQGSVKNRLELKDLLMRGKNILNQNVAPGVPIWVIRHFLGLLPTPIFPPKSDEHYWYNFSTRYYEQFVDSIKRRRACNEFKENIAFELSHLPGRNLTFLFEFFELIRFLSMNSMTDNLDKHAVLMLAKYFTPSLMIRPYRPGILTKDVKKYVIFISFCVYFWSDLRDKIHDYMKTSMNKNPLKFYYYPETYDKYDENNYLKNNETQTELDSDIYLNIESSSDEYFGNFNDKKKSFTKLKTGTPNHENLKLSEFESMELIDELCIFKSSTPKRKKQQSLLLQDLNTQNFHDYYETIKKDNCKFLKTVSTQTDAFSDSNHVSISSKSKVYPKKLSVKYNCRIKRPKRKRKTDIHDIILLEIPRYRLNNNLKNAKLLTYKRCKLQTCNVKNNNKNVTESKMNIDEQYFSTKSKSNEEMKTANCSIITYDWNINSIINNGEYVYDSYIGNYYDETPHRPRETSISHTPCELIINEKNVNDSYMGNYYGETRIPFQPKKLFSEVNTPCDNTKMGFVTPPSTPSIDLYKRITQYGWTYNPPKPPCSVDQYEPYVLCFESDQKSMQSLNSMTPLTENVKKKKKSFLNISSKFSFFKKFTNSSKKSMSYTDLNSNVKYEKIAKSANSI